MTMRIFIFIFLIALTTTSVSTPWIRRLAIGWGFVDTPSQRKLHKAPMPLLGGLAIFGGAIGTVLLFYGRLPDTIVGVLLSSSVVALVGLWDDRRGLPAWAKLLGQFIGTLILAYFGIRVQLPVPDVVNILLTFLWVATISNATNFLDNMDGLTAGISGVSAAFILLLAALHGQFLVAALAAAIVGACFGFLRYNFKPAQIFMGDAGALFLGFLLAVLALQLRFPENSNFVTWMVPLFVLGLPLFDMSLVVFSRIRRGVSPGTAGKDHISHRLVKLGFTQREAVLILYLVAGAFGMASIFITRATPLEGYTIGGITAVAGLYAMFWFDRSPQSG
ncbi:MAG: MraY family glycosyltransferase [Chloroflexota bacterium]